MNATVNPSEIPFVRTWNGAPLSPVEEMLMYHKDAGPVPETLRRLRSTLDREGIEFVVIGAMAMGVHGYRRATEDVGLCLRAEDLERFREQLVGSVYQAVEGRSRRFYDPETQVTFDLLVSGKLAGRVSRNNEIHFPDPAEAEDFDGLPTVKLERLIELKLVTWRFKDMADVIELIRGNGLGEDYAARLHPLVRNAYLQCYDHKKEEDRYDAEADEH